MSVEPVTLSSTSVASTPDCSTPLPKPKHSEHVAFQTLQALIRASPTYLALYGVRRPSILKKLLDTALPSSIIIDAFAALNPNEKWPDDKLLSILNEDACIFALMDVSLLELSIQQTLRMLHFHTEHVEPLVKGYAEWALPMLEDKISEWPAEKHVLNVVPSNRGLETLGVLEGKASDLPSQKQVLEAASSYEKGTLGILDDKAADQPRPAQAQGHRASPPEEARIMWAVYRLILLVRITHCVQLEDSKSDKEKFDENFGSLVLWNNVFIWHFRLWDLEAMRCIATFFEARSLSKAAEQLFPVGPCSSCRFRGWEAQPYTQEFPDKLIGDFRVDMERAGLLYDRKPVLWDWLEFGDCEGPMPVDRKKGEKLDTLRKMGYVLWDDDRMLRWARRMGTRWMQDMGFTGCDVPDVE